MLRYIFCNSHLQNIPIRCKYSCWKHVNKKNKLKLLTEVYQAPEKDSVTYTQLGSALGEKGASTAYVCLHTCRVQAIATSPSPAPERSQAIRSFSC